MQSLQDATNTTNPDFASYLERRSSPDKKNKHADHNDDGGPSDQQERDKSPVAPRPSTPTPSSQESPRPSSRYLSKPILGENTPPSSAMLALQNMQVPVDLPSSPSAAGKDSSANNTPAPTHEEQPHDPDSLAAQINSLTRIATSLQQEMSNLSRRSKDNATDLVSLKAATNARDEDIRNGLKDLTSSLSTKFLRNESSMTPKSAPQMRHSADPLMIDNQEHNASPSSRKNYMLPRIPSPSSFAAAMERELTASPAATSTDGSASVALLEKVIREMATKEGQEKLLQLVEDVKSRPAEKGTDTSMSKMLEEILDLVKESSSNRALVRAPSGDNGHVAQSPPEKHNLAAGASPGDPLSRASSMEPEQRGVENSDTQAANRLSEDVLQILKRIKSSVAEGGGLTSEVKALVRELRGEVLGMGREIARKIEQAEANRSSNEVVPRGPGKEEIGEIVEGGLYDLRGQMDHLIRESRRKPPPPEPSNPQLGSDDVYAVVKHALSEIPLPEPPAPQISGSSLEKDEILDTVREAWETYKPEIELQNFGLEREEILECLTEGLKGHQLQNEESTRSPGVTYEEVLDAIHHSLENWAPPRMEPDVSMTREAVMASVQECLENFEWPTPPSAAERGGAISHEDVLSAVKEGLLQKEGLPLNGGDFPRDDLYEAVRSGFHEASDTLNNHVGEQVMEQFHGLAGEMKTEFKQYSAANGRDTEQVLDAVKDGLEVLRGEIESYVDRAADVTGKDEIIDAVKEGFGFLHADVEKCITQTAQNSGSQPPQTVELLDAMEKEFEHLRQTMSNLLVQNSVSTDKDEILDAIRDVSHNDRDRGSGIGSDSGADLGNMMKDEFQHLRETLSTTIMNPAGSADKDEIIAALKEGLDTVLDDHGRRKDGNESVVSNTSELLDAFNDGVDVLRADMEKVLDRPADSSSNSDEILNSLKGGLSEVKDEIERLREHQKTTDGTQTARGRELMLGSESSIGSDIESLKVLVTQLQIKVDAIDVHPAAPETDPSIVKKDDLLEVLEAIKEIQGVVGEAKTGEDDPPPSGAARKEDTDAIETLVRNTKAQLDELMTDEKDKTATPERIEALEALAKDTKDLFEGFTAHLESEGATKSDVSNVETVLRDVWVVVEELKTSSTSDDGAAADKVGKEDVKNLETLLFEMKSQLEDFVLTDVKSLPSKDEIQDLTKLVTEFRDKADEENELTAQAFESRKVEHGALGEKIDEAKAFVTEIRDELKTRLGDSEESLVDVKSMIDTLNESSGSFAKAESIKELSELVSREFERSHGDREAAKMEAEEREFGVLAKHEEGRAGAVAEVVAKMEEKFNEVLEKYEHAQELVASRFTAVEERDTESLETLTSTKSLAEDIKLVIGGMGNSVSEACERMGDDAKTFFDRVDQSFEKMDGLHVDMTAHREHINDQFQKTLQATDRLEQQMAGSHPEMLAAVKEVIALVGQHYEHSQRTTAELKTDLSAIPPLLPAPLPEASSSTTREMPPPQLPDAPSQEKYDDSGVQDKLDTLIEHATTAGESNPQMDKLQQIQEQVAATARDVSEMMAAQSKPAIEDQESKRTEEREVGDSLEKRVAQREKVEGEVVALSDERESLMQTVKGLKGEKEQLTSQNTEMAKELARTETALRIRREEVEMMEERAERIERRIVEDVLDHARAMVTSKPGGSDAASTSLRRAPSEASTVTRESVASTAPDSGSAVSSMVGMALKRQTPSRSNTAAGSTMTSSSSLSSNRGSGRRILSHSHVTGNRRPTDRQTIAPASGNNAQSGFGNLKRSQSVKSNYGLTGRKASWEPRLSIANKENEVVKEEEEEEEAEEEGRGRGEGDASGDEAPSESGTERRTSYTGTLDSMSYVTGSAISLSTDRRTSYGSTNALVSAEPASWMGRHEDAYSQSETRSEAATEPEDWSIVRAKAADGDGENAGLGCASRPKTPDAVSSPIADSAMVLGAPPHSDSGLGMDVISAGEKKPAVT